jgi:D-threo-aldose 1-dehydrogenase
VTATGLGCARLGSSVPGYGWRDAVRLVDAAVDAGVTYFDTADAYGAGASELVLGRALRGRRHAVTLATKGGYRFTERSMIESRARTAAAALRRRVRDAVPGSGRAGTPTDRVASSNYASQDFSPEHLSRALEGSLRRLGTDYVEVYQLHGPRDLDPDAVGEWATAMIAAGKFGKLGIGAESLDQVRTWLEGELVGSVQLPYGVLDPEAGRELIPTAHTSGRAVVVRCVLGAGLLTDPTSAGSSNSHKSPLIVALRELAADAGVGIAELAVSFVARRPDVDIVVVGTASPTHLAEVAAVVTRPLVDASVWNAVDNAIERHRWE